MSFRIIARVLTTVLLTAMLTTALPLAAGDRLFQDNFSSDFFNASPPCPVKQIPTFESIVPVPPVIDLFELDLIPVFCEIQVQRNGRPVKRAKGRYVAELIVRDNNTNRLFPSLVGSGRFKTDFEGRDSFDFDLPAELFADGFESGDVSAWSYTRSDFTNRKKASDVSVHCRTGNSSSSE